MLPDAPAVSVIVTTFNRLPLLTRALRSVDSQTWRDCELIVMDDGSSDGTREFLERARFGLPFRYEILEGAERATLRNRGAAIARGKLLSFLDDDDEWLPSKVEKQVQAMVDAPRCAASYCFTTPVDADGRTLDDLAAEHLAMYRRNVRAGHTFGSLCRSMLIFTSAVMVRRDTFITLGGYDERFVPAEDWYFYMRLAMEGDIIALEEPLVRYRVHAGNFTTGAGRDKLARLSQARIAAAADMLKVVRRNGSSADEMESVLLRFIASNHYAAGSSRTALTYAMRAIRKSPRALSFSDMLSWVPRAIVKSVVEGRGT